MVGAGIEAGVGTGGGVGGVGAIGMGTGLIRSGVADAAPASNRLACGDPRESGLGAVDPGGGGVGELVMLFRAGAAGTNVGGGGLLGGATGVSGFGGLAEKNNPCPRDWNGLLISAGTSTGL